MRLYIQEFVSSELSRNPTSEVISGHGWMGYVGAEQSVGLHGGARL